MLFRSNDTATTEIYTRKDTLSLHDALLISEACNHYGIQVEHLGAIAPFAGIAAPAWSRAEPREMPSVAEPLLAGT